MNRIKKKHQKLLHQREKNVGLLVSVLKWKAKEKLVKVNIKSGSAVKPPIRKTQRQKRRRYTKIRKNIYELSAHQAQTCLGCQSLHHCIGPKISHTAGRFTHLIVSEWLVTLTCHSDVLARNVWTMLASNIQACLNVLHMCDENDSKITSSCVIWQHNALHKAAT